jgi:hypothetical protein
MLRGRELQCKALNRLLAQMRAKRSGRYREAIERLSRAASPFIWPALTSCRTGARCASGPGSGWPDTVTSAPCHARAPS